MWSIGLGRYILAAKYFEHIMFCPGGRYDQIAAAGGPADQWDALPTNAKLQIILFVGLLELYSESANVRSTRPRDTSCTRVALFGSAWPILLRSRRIGLSF